MSKTRQANYKEVKESVGGSSNMLQMTAEMVPIFSGSDDIYPRGATRKYSAPAERTERTPLQPMKNEDFRRNVYQNRGDISKRSTFATEANLILDSVANKDYDAEHSKNDLSLECRATGSDGALSLSMASPLNLEKDVMTATSGTALPREGPGIDPECAQPPWTPGGPTRLEVTSHGCPYIALS
ncbi:hypothetical protein ACJJTC_000197 [Scirpophaga incertulas]